MGGKAKVWNCGRVENIWPTLQADRGSLMKPMSPCISVEIHFFCLHQHSSSSASQPLPFSSSMSHLNICLAVWWVPSCLTVSPNDKANNLLHGPLYPRDCENIWMEKTYEHRRDALGKMSISIRLQALKQVCFAHSSGVSTTNHQLLLSMQH